MEMSAKLVDLSMENENLIHNNDQLEQRLVEVECKLKESVSWCIQYDYAAVAEVARIAAERQRGLPLK